MYGIGDERLYPTVAAQAAVLAESIIANHPFEQGNKRTAYAAMQTFLAINGYILMANHEESFEFICGIACGKIGTTEAIAWVEGRTEALA